MKLYKISIVVPCYNMVQYIEATILSIINQNYKNLELIIIDGGSNDGTIEILNQYKDHFFYFISEKDSGQYYAINKGFKIASGEIIAWLNADDIYYPWTFNLVNKIFCDHTNISWISGQSSFLDESGNTSKINNTLSSKNQKAIQNGLFNGRPYGYLQQEGMFWKREVIETCGYLNTDLKLAADYELWIRFSKMYELVSVEIPLAGFRKRATSRSNSLKKEYENEVNKFFKLTNKKVFYRILYNISRSPLVKVIIRLLIWKPSYIYYFSLVKQKWILTKKIRPMGNMSFSQLLLEM